MSAAFEIEAKMVAASLSEAAQEALERFGLEPVVQVAADLDDMRSGTSASDLLAEILSDTFARETAQGWREYVAILGAHLAREMKS